jgi:hypothetical protein
MKMDNKTHLLMIYMKKIFDNSIKKIFLLCFIFNFLLVLTLTLYFIFYGGLGFGFADKEASGLMEFLASIWISYPARIFEFLNLLILIESTFFTIVCITLVDSIILTPFVLIIHTLISKFKEKRRDSS